MRDYQDRADGEPERERQASVGRRGLQPESRTLTSVWPSATKPGQEIGRGVRRWPVLAGVTPKQHRLSQPIRFA